MRLKRASDNGAKLYYMKGILYSIMFHSTQMGQIISINFHTTTTNYNENEYHQPNCVPYLQEVLL
jgi:hypothetical protein